MEQFINYWLPYNIEMFMSILEIVLAVLNSGFVIALLKLNSKEGSFLDTMKSIFKKKESFDGLLKEFVKINNNIDNALLQVKNLTNIPKIAIMEFHNGNYINHRSIKKYTMTYEHSSPGEQPFRELFKNRSLEEWSGIIGQYKTNPFIVLGETSEELSEEQRNFFKYKGYTKVVVQGLFYKKEDLYPRAVVACYCTDDCDMDKVKVELGAVEQILKENLFYYIGK